MVGHDQPRCAPCMSLQLSRLVEWPVYCYTPAQLSERVRKDEARPALYSDQFIVESYKTGGGSVRRVYVARGEKVYFIDLLPDDGTCDAINAYMRLSLTFTQPMMRPQPMAAQMFAEESRIYARRALSV